MTINDKGWGDGVDRSETKRDVDTQKFIDKADEAFISRIQDNFHWDD